MVRLIVIQYSTIQHAQERSVVYDVSTCPSSLGKRYFVFLANHTSDSMMGTSVRTPTTVTSVAPGSTPKSEMATATASSKKLESGDKAPRGGNLKGKLKFVKDEIGNREHRMTEA